MRHETESSSESHQVAWWSYPLAPAAAVAVAFVVVAAACLFDHTAGRLLELRITDALVVALLLRRPTLVRPGLVGAFLADAIVGVGFGGDLAALFEAGLHVGLDAAALWLVHLRGIDGRRLRSTRDLVETMIVVAVAQPLFGAGIVAAMSEIPDAAGLAFGRTADWPAALLGAASLTPLVLLMGHAVQQRRFAAADLPFFALAAAAAIGIGWVSGLWLRFPFIVTSVPLLVAATRLPAVPLALLSALCMVELTNLVVVGSQPGASDGIVAAAAALTGFLPVALCLLLGELREERRRVSESAGRIRQILDGISGQGYADLDGRGRVVGWNDKMARLTGFAVEDAIGRPFETFFVAADCEAEIPQKLLERAIERGTAWHTGWRMRGDGARFWAKTTLETTKDATGAIVGFVEIVQDLSDLKRSQNALISAERLWGFALGSTGQGVWEHDLITGEMQYSDVYLSMLGVTAETLGNDPAAWKRYIHPEDAGAIAVDPADPADFREREFRLRHADGRWIWVAERRQIVETDDTGRATRIIGVHADITARKLAEEKFRLAVEASPNGLLIVASDGRIGLANREAERMFGYEPGALLGVGIEDLVPEAHRGEHIARRAAFGGLPIARSMGVRRNISGCRRDGSPVPVEIGLHPISTTEGAHVLCVVTDITDRKRAEAELAFTEARYRTMADHFTDLVCHLDLDFNRTWVSPASFDLLGVTPDSLIGATSAKLVHPDDIAEVMRVQRAVANGLDRGNYTARYRHGAGRWVWMSVSLRLIRRSVDGQPTGILKVARDVTRARAAEEALKASEATFRGAMESASIGMALEALAGHWISVNRALGAILGYDEEELLDRDDASELVLPEDRPIDRVHRRRLLAGEISSYQVEKRWQHRSGRPVWTQQSVSLARGSDGSPRHFILQIQDITERKQIEQMKSEFVSMVSHELRTPLTSIRGALGLVLGTMTKTLPPRAHQLIDIAHKNSERLIPLVNDILDLDKIDGGMIQVNIVEVDAVSLIRQVVETTRAYADRFGVALAMRLPAGPVPIHVDEGRFIQVITNLVSNAAKFSPRESTVDVVATPVGETVRISVVDRGPGIAEEFRSRIFGRFAQADSATTRSKGGSGLGLHISRQLVDLMGGQIGFDTVPGEGSTFWVEFPIRRTPSLGAAAAADEPAQTSRGDVLIVACDSAMAEYLTTVASEAGFGSRLATTAAEMRSCLMSACVRAILVDQALAAGADGEAFAGLFTTDGPPVALVAAAAEPIDAAEDLRRVAAVWRFDAPEPMRLVHRLRALVEHQVDGLPRILHVEDDVDLTEIIATALRGQAHVVRATRVASALRTLRSESFDMIVIDPDLPDGDGLALLSPHIDRERTCVLVLSADETGERPEAAVARLVKSRISEPQIVATILDLLRDRRPKRVETRHAG